jgi:hypothetical protein
VTDAVGNVMSRVRYTHSSAMMQNISPKMACHQGYLCRIILVVGDHMWSVRYIVIKEHAQIGHALWLQLMRGLLFLHIHW